MSHLTKLPINARAVIRLTALPVLIASLCCLAPVILVTLGLSTVAFAASLTDTLDGKYRWLFIVFGLILLAVSIVSFLRKSNICTFDQAIRRRNEVINLVAIVFVVSTIVYIIFFYVVVGYAGKLLNIWN
jgi:hypothetical protein